MLAPPIGFGGWGACAGAVPAAALGTVPCAGVGTALCDGSAMTAQVKTVHALLLEVMGSWNRGVTYSDLQKSVPVKLARLLL